MDYLTEYNKIELGSYSAEELSSLLLEDANVLLKVSIDSSEFSCSVTSYSYRRTYYEDVFHIYHPKLCLSHWSEGPIVVKSNEEWTEEFLSGNTCIDIYSEFYCPCDNDIEQIQDVLSSFEEQPNQIELYLSDDYRNFHGPLECDFIEWWIENHPGYHTEIIFFDE